MSEGTLYDRWVSLSKNVLQSSLTHQLKISGKERALQLNPLDVFYTVFGRTDVNITFLKSKENVAVFSFVKELQENGWEILSQHNYRTVSEPQDKISDILLIHPEQFVLVFNVYHEDRKYDTFKMLHATIHDDGITFEKNDSYIYELGLYHSKIDLTNDSLYANLLNTINKHLIEKVTDTKIGLLSYSNGDYYVKDFSIKSKVPPFIFPDLHYGNGFEEFHNSLITRLKENNKGLVLFHGKPGTGKSSYVRILIDELCKANASILYAPSGLSSMLTDPNIIEFISEWIVEKNRHCFLLIEDAEPLLEMRSNGDNRSTGISNLLNITDGILNDILGLTVIATFNTELSKLDPALLRQQRLIARKEFKELSEAECFALAEAIGLKEIHCKEYPVSLADFYSKLNSFETLLHDVSIKKKSIGF